MIFFILLNFQSISSFFFIFSIHYIRLKMQYRKTNDFLVWRFFCHWNISILQLTLSLFRWFIYFSSESTLWLTSPSVRLFDKTLRSVNLEIEGIRCMIHLVCQSFYKSMFLTALLLLKVIVFVSILKQRRLLKKLFLDRLARKRKSINNCFH